MRLRKWINRTGRTADETRLVKPLPRGIPRSLLPLGAAVCDPNGNRGIIIGLTRSYAIVELQSGDGHVGR
jgi:hypothetical protein